MNCNGRHSGAGARKGEWTPGQCRICWILLNPFAPGDGGACARALLRHENVDLTPDALALIQSPPPQVVTSVPPGARHVRATPPPLERLRCAHLGEATGETARPVCGQCQPVPLHRCAVHEVCTPGEPTRNAHRRCLTCSDHAPAFRRHLLYHVYPRRGPTWRWNVEQLRRRIGLFDGRKVVAVVTDHTTDPAGDVRAALEGTGCEFIEMANDPALQETLTHQPLFSRLADLGAPEDVTLRAHAKGTTNFSWNDGGATIRLWAQTLYETYLDYWPVVADLLARHPLAGSLRRRGRYFHPHSPSDWHYSGSWYWMRNRDLLARDWRRIEPHSHAVETYPSLHFDPSEAGVIWGRFERQNEASWPYRPEMWRENLPLLGQWKAANVTRRTVFPLAARASEAAQPRLCVIVPTIGRPSLARTLASIRTAGLAEADEVLVVADGPCPEARAMWEGAGLPGRLIETPARAGDWGYTPRNLAMAEARGDWLVFIDDDDAYAPGTLDRVRGILAGAPRRPHLFRVRFIPERTLAWQDPVLRIGNVSTQGIVVPNDPARLGRWGSRYQGDYDFAASTCAFYPEGPAWREEVLVDAFPARDLRPGLPAPAQVALDIGCGDKKKPGFLGVDRRPLPGVDACVDFETLHPGGGGRLPFADESVSEVFCARSGQRVCTPDGWRPIETIRRDDLVLGKSGFVRVRGNFIRPHRGRIFRIKTADGIAEVTAEHPIATPLDWTKADQLRKDANVIVCAPEIKPSQIVDSGNVLCHIARLASFCPGRGAGVVDRQPSFAEGNDDFSLSPLPLEEGQAAAKKLNHFCLLAVNGNPIRLFSLSMRRSPRPAKAVTNPLRAKHDAHGFQETSVAVGNLDLGLYLRTRKEGKRHTSFAINKSGKVGPINVSHGLSPVEAVEFYHFVGPVYNLETDDGTFFLEGILTHNSSHCFEHVVNLKGLLWEVARVCRPGSAVEVRVPHHLSQMALCHDHKQVIPPIQVDHWCESELAYWWQGSPRRLAHVRSEQVPGENIAAARPLHPGWSDEQLMTFVPGCAFEWRYFFRVVENRECP